MAYLCAMPTLPIDQVVGDLGSALARWPVVVLQAPPGAGKTTGVPLALRDQDWLGGRRLVMLEPRRIAARAAANRMAALLGETVGGTVGYRTRLDTRVSARTRIEVVTEGVLTRMLQHDPTLDGYGLVIFDEFHERNLHADAGLALARHAQALVRPELRLLVMSATLDGAALAQRLGHAPVIVCSGRQFFVETRYLPHPREMKIESAAARAVRTALAAHEGDLLVFLPGAREIHRTASLLAAEPLPIGVDVLTLHGMLGADEQDRVIRPAPPGRRKVVLATSIAETSLTIEGVRVVIDTGLSRRPRFSPRLGMTRLDTLRVSRSAADQRRGRAGRLAPGVCYRLWHEIEDAQLVPAPLPEILETDLTPLALDLAGAGIADPLELAWLDPPPAAAYAQARELLRQLDALDSTGRVTSHGQAMSRLGLHPRLAHMVLRAAHEGNRDLACDLAALLSERDILRRDPAPISDLRVRVDMLRRATDPPDADRSTLHRVRAQAAQFRRAIPSPNPPGHASRDTSHDTGRVLALAYPDRVAQRRRGQQPRFVQRNGAGVMLAPDDPLAPEDFIVVAESDGRSPESRVFLAAPLTLADVTQDFATQIDESDIVEWHEEAGVVARRQRRLGAIVLAERRVRDPDPDAVAEAIAREVRRRGAAMLPWSDAAVQLRQRLSFLHAIDASWPDVSDGALLATLLSALVDQLGAVRSAADLRRVDVHAALLHLLSREQRAQLERLAPTHFTAPSGSRVRIDYQNPDAPAASVRLQEMFGATTTPAVFGGRTPITLHLLSPSHRPVQVTRDLASFWRSSYFDVRKDLRARYPKHHWPDDPLTAEPPSRARGRRRA